MAYIKERGNNNYLMRVSHSTLENGRPFEKSRLFHPSKINLPESKLRKELDAFVKALEEECRLDYEKRLCNKDETIVESDLNTNTQQAVHSTLVKVDIPSPTSNTPLFKDFCNVYIETKKETISPTTHVLYNTSIDRMLITHFGTMHLDKIKPFHLQEFINFLSTPDDRIDNKGEKLAPATVRRYLTIMQSIMTMTWKQDYITTNPADSRRLEFAKIITPEVEAFDNEEVAEILDKAKLEPIHIHAVIATAIYTGAKRGEIAGLKWEDIDFGNRTLHIRRSVVKVAGEEPEVKLPKTISSIRQISIPQALCDIFRTFFNEYFLLTKTRTYDRIFLNRGKYFYNSLPALK